GNPTLGAALGQPSSATLTITNHNGTANDRFVVQIYNDVLQRQADPGGLAFFSNALNTGVLNRAQVVAALTGSFEYPALAVNSFYTLYLHRNAAPGALAFWGNALATVPVRQLEVALLGSLEYFQRRGGNTRDGFLDAMYGDTLARGVDSGARVALDNMLAAGF